MKYVVIIMSLFCLSATRCNKATSPGLSDTIKLIQNDCYPDRKSIQNHEDLIGTIIKLSDQYIILANNGESRFTACNLPESVQTDSLGVKFSLIEKEVYPNERWMATPAVLSHIEITK